MDTPTIPIAKGEPIAGQPRTFELIRHKDHSGVSGIGLVCWGVVYPDGRVSTRWAQSEFGRQTSAWDCLDDVLSVHGHKGSTEIRWHDGGDENGPPELDGDDVTASLYALMREAQTAIRTAANQGNHMLGIVSAQFVVDCLLDSGFVDSGS